MTLFAIDFGAIIPIIFVIIWIISQIAGAANQQPKARRRQQGPQANPQPAGDVDAEIEQFLLKAADKRGAAPAAPVEVAQPIVLERVEPMPQQAEPVLERAEPQAKRLGDLDTSDFDRRTSQLGSGVRAGKNQMTERSRKMKAARSKKFDHDLGQLDKTATTDRSEQVPEKKKPIPRSATAGIAAMLADGQSLRDAIIFSEIIKRPEDRW